MRSAFLALATGLVVPAALSFAGQLGELSGPTVGYVFSSGDATLRPVRGVLGSATIGAPVAVDIAITGVLALDGHHFLASTADGMVFISLESGTPAIVPLTGVPPNPSGAAGSRRGTAAALYYEGPQQLVVVAGLPSSPGVAHVVDISPQGGPVTRMAVNDTGTMVVYSVSGGGRDGVFTWTAGSPAERLLATAGSVSAIALARNDDAVVADAAGHQLFVIRDPAERGSLELFAGHAAGISSPVGVLLTDDGRVFVANAASPTILALNSRGDPGSALSCACEPSGFHRFGDSVYRLTDRLDRTIYLLDTSGARQRVFFVPPLSGR
jgi:hypothetical protein